MLLRIRKHRIRETFGVGRRHFAIAGQRFKVAVNADLRYAAAWVPAALLEGEWISLGLVSDGLPATSHLNATLSIVIPLCFVFGFICMARHPSKEKA